MAKKTKKNIAHTKEAGFITAKLNPKTDLYVVLYGTKAAGMDTSRGKYTAFCAAHGTFCGETSKSRATKLINNPSLWCSDCDDIADVDWNKSLVVVPYSAKTPEEREREMRVMAVIARGNEEKARLFETIYGVNPNQFWD
jgi:hypothetical protein